jgi:glycerophosphoryl diester phosphodiesterase
MIIAHRGAKGMAPENTLAAFKLGMEHGCEGIELDVHLSVDGEILVCHDATLDRTSNGTGRICEHTLSEIQSFDAGLWYGEAYKGERIPTLAEVFDLVPASIMINVEVKEPYEGRMETELIKFLRERGRMDNVVISSFDHKCVRRIKLAEPKAKIGLLYQTKLLDPLAYARSFDVDVYSLHPYYQLLDAEDVQAAVAGGLKVYPYTANSEKDLLQLTSYGVSGIITDFPGRLKAMLEPEKNQ